MNRCIWMHLHWNYRTSITMKENLTTEKNYEINWNKVFKLSVSGFSEISEISDTKLPV